MLGNYEKRSFSDGVKIWVGHYRNLTNVLHWHVECEIISVVKGKAQIRIGEHCYEAREGDSFFCAGEELHYIISEPDSLVNIMIIDKNVARDISDKYTILSPKLPTDIPIDSYFDRMEAEILKKAPFYSEALENQARGLFIEIFRNSEITKRDDKSLFDKKLINKIHDEFSFITFEDAVRYSGYSPSHFSKLFKSLSGMNFSEYLNVIKIENAIAMMRTDNTLTMTSISLACGFSTVRNFNRVFKEITGYSPRSLPEDFMTNTGLRISKYKNFDPTDKGSVLI